MADYTPTIPLDADDEEGLDLAMWHYNQAQLGLTPPGVTLNPAVAADRRTFVRQQCRDLFKQRYSRQFKADLEARRLAAVKAATRAKEDQVDAVVNLPRNPYQTLPPGATDVRSVAPEDEGGTPPSTPMAPSGGSAPVARVEKPEPTPESLVPPSRKRKTEGEDAPPMPAQPPVRPWTELPTHGIQQAETMRGIPRAKPVWPNGPPSFTWNEVVTPPSRWQRVQAWIAAHWLSLWASMRQGLGGTRL